MKHDKIQQDDFYYPVTVTPLGKIPVVGSTMTDEREREIADKYGVYRELIVRERARRLGFFLQRHHSVYTLNLLSTFKTVMKSNDICELDRWLDAQEGSIL